MTEDEADKKRCPRPSPWVLEHGGWCIGSECMAWRVERAKPTGTTYGGAAIGGYCGLAGQPT